MQTAAAADADSLAPLAVVVIGLTYGLVDGNLVMPVSQTGFALSCGVLLGCFFPAASGATPLRRPPAVVATTFALASAACLVAYVLLTLPQQAENEAAWRRASQYPDLAPRFWQQGLLR
jgi:hypothetical protein